MHAPAAGLGARYLVITPRQASLLPVRQVRSQSLLERLIAKSGQTSALFGRGPPPQPPRSPASSLFGRNSPPSPEPPSPGPFGTAAGSGGGDGGGGGSPAPGLLAMQRSYSSSGSLTVSNDGDSNEEEYKEYSAEAVESLLLLLARAAAGAGGAAGGAAGGEGGEGGEGGAQAGGGAGGAAAGRLLVRGVERLVTVQAAVELLMELLLDSSAGVVLDREHVTLLTDAHAAACTSMRRAFQGAPSPARTHPRLNPPSPEPTLAPAQVASPPRSAPYSSMSAASCPLPSRARSACLRCSPTSRCCSRPPPPPPRETWSAPCRSRAGCRETTSSRRASPYRLGLPPLCRPMRPGCNSV